MLVEDTYAEAFRSIYGRILITADSRRWLDAAAAAATGHASSTIMCDCEAGVERIVDGVSAGEETPDGRLGAYLQFHVPRFRKDRVDHLERVMLARISQNVLTCPTLSCFNAIESPDYFKLGRKIALFGDGYQYRTVRFGERLWAIPTLGGEFVLSRRFGYADGLMGGNVWFMGTRQSALAAAEAAVAAVEPLGDVITPFPGGIAASGSKAGSRYSFLIASTYAEFCPTLRESLGDASKVPPGVESIQEIIVNGRDLASVSAACHAAVAAASATPDLVRISAGNYGGRLGKSFIYLRPELH